MMYRSVGSAGLAVIAFLGMLPVAAFADDELALSQAMPSDDLSQVTARGGETSTTVDETVGNVSSSASAEASIDHVTIVGPASTGGVSGLSDLLGNTDVHTMQISTGSGNIQQGVSAVALTF